MNVSKLLTNYEKNGSGCLRLIETLRKSYLEQQPPGDLIICHDVPSMYQYGVFDY